MCVERRDKTTVTTPHQIIIQDRKCIEITGVSDIDNFDDTVITAYTPLGELTVRGKGLQVKQLCVETGSLSVEGQIDTLFYADVRKGGFLGRLLR